MNNNNSSIKNLVLFVFLIFTMFMTGCAAFTAAFTEHGKLTKNADEAYRAGNYDEAVKHATKALKHKPGYGDAQKVLVNSFSVSIRNRESRIAELASRTDLKSVANHVKEYQTLIRISNSVKNLPPLIDDKSKKPIKFTFKDYTGQLKEAKNTAAETYYKHGHKMGKIGGVENSKSAAKAFKKSQSYIPQYKDTEELYEKFKLAGIKRIAIFSFINKSGQNKYGAIGELVSDQVTSTIMGTESAIEFLNILSRTELEQSMKNNGSNHGGLVDHAQIVKIGKSLDLHEVIIGQITQINVLTPQSTEKYVEEKNSVVVGEKEYLNRKGKKRTKPVYGDVHAKVKIYKMVANAKITGSYKIIDIKSAQLKKTDSFSGEYKYNHKWASYTGDERGLS
ncbi:MAG: tetratricopeptide repeat protein, partial [Gammaproteobacteria bacterium]|nr:tetratricopeptide repeat protein [Gammaproteobacteria bacterium]